MKTWFSLLCAITLTVSIASAESLDENTFYETWNRTLKKHVSNQSVDYQALKEDSADLSEFLQRIEQVDYEVFRSWDDAQQIAFWINAYNALILQTVINHYPISAGFSLKGLAYPKNSIQQISNVWDRKELQVFGSTMSANNIEHDTLRKQFEEPRIHFALVCASVGCPPIRAEAYTADKLDTQLEEQTRLFLSDSEKNRYANDEIEISKIFKWFEEDFSGKSGVLQFIAARKPEWKINDSTKVSYLEYDWGLNDK